jgi:DNA invertase Pin-like site-specific DNA recombinase
VVVWKLDRLSRSLKELLHIMEHIERAGAGFRSLTEAIDTTTPAGRMLMQMVGSFAEFERAMIRERTQAGLAAARARGRIGGRRPKLTPQQQAAIVDMVHAGRQSQADAARLFHVHPATVSRLVAAHRQQVAPAWPPVDAAASGNLPGMQRALSTHGTHSHPAGPQELTR